ncbi:MAG: hypothetical protein ABI761_15720 [Saprospiraceae bacterium]
MEENKEIEDKNSEKLSNENITSVNPIIFNPNQEPENMEVPAKELHKVPDNGFKHYLFEFLMLFLAVFCGFLAENYRESLVDKAKELHYMQNMVADLKADTTDLNFSISYQQLWSNHLDSALQIPIECLIDINTQDTFFYHFFPYYSWMQPFAQNDNTMTQLRAGGFNLIRNENTIDSINLLYNVYKGVKFGMDFNIVCYWDVVHKAQQLMNLPAPAAVIEEVIPKRFLENTEIFINYDKPAIKQLYSMMTNANGTLVNTIVAEKQYLEKAKRLLAYLQWKYHLK